MPEKMMNLGALGGRGDRFQRRAAHGDGGERLEWIGYRGQEDAREKAAEARFRERDHGAAL